MPALTAPARRTRRGDLEARAEQLLAAMASIRRSGRLLARRPGELSGLTDSQLDLVRLVLRRPGVSVTQAAEDLSLAPNTVSTLVRQLTEQHVLVRAVDPDDRRVARLALTPRMARELEDFRDRRVAMLAAALAQCPPAERQLLDRAAEVLDRVAEDLRGQETDHG
jgi:DNA-binding MarR family transcriptional regulator